MTASPAGRAMLLRNFYLYLAVFWLGIGIALVFRSWMGWLAVLMGLYSLARWYSMRSAAEQQALTAERLRRRRERPREPAERDPTFDFSDPPPPPA
jgi:hypothetical protein